MYKLKASDDNTRFVWSSFLERDIKDTQVAVVLHLNGEATIEVYNAEHLSDAEKYELVMQRAAEQSIGSNNKYGIVGKFLNFYFIG